MWANAIVAAWKRLWQSDFPVSTPNSTKTSAVACGSALHMRRMQLRGETQQQAFQRLQRLRAQIAVTNKFNPRRGDLESQARQAVRVIFSEGVKK
jgi:hypothetical protein